MKQRVDQILGISWKGRALRVKHLRWLCQERHNSSEISYCSGLCFCFFFFVWGDNSIFSRMKTFPRHLGTHVYALRCLSPWSAEFTVSRKFPRTSKKSLCTASRRVHSTVLSRTSLHPCSSPTFNFPTICPVNLPGIRVSLSLSFSLRFLRSSSSGDYAIKVARMIIETRTRSFRRSKSVGKHKRHAVCRIVWLQFLLVSFDFRKWS